MGQASKVRKLYGDSSRKWGGKGAREGVWREDKVDKTEALLRKRMGKWSTVVAFKGQIWEGLM